MAHSLTADVKVTRLTGTIGAEIGGVDAGGPLGDETVARIRQALNEHKVVFLRGQDLDYQRQVAFARNFGDLTLGHPIYDAPSDQPHLREMDSRHGTRANHWHTDLTFIQRPPAYAFLHGKVIPPVGGDTIWANTVTAYQSLPEELRDLADRLRIVHSNDCDFTDDTYAHRAENGDQDDYISTPYETAHPAVRVHPQTGERALMLGGFARRVVGYGPQASRDLIRVLQEYVTRPEQTVRWKWRAGDLVIWDNQATQHYAVYDYGSEYRRGERVTVAGPVPVGVDGRPSTVLRGDTSSYSTGSAPDSGEAA
ncbi:TauD/TfdA family dioxygenase [Streptomyces sp. MST-110588]|uniref:TauD/TfdA dioxygenase family protein n=1 Tax=Streptomyces sp. MST-110588 TaxID=2833628 RepID=UPI001F5DF0E7|nr:TauD/TfdA family dioxygenase [Streptomyces sp. MST-110588]UNO39195.1 TauD/TfdA family dioxygenase [Streptomyces sp. MST-110588]